MARRREVPILLAETGTPPAWSLTADLSGTPGHGLDAAAAKDGAAETLEEAHAAAVEASENLEKTTDRVVSDLSRKTEEISRRLREAGRALVESLVRSGRLRLSRVDGPSADAKVSDSRDYGTLGAVEAHSPLIVDVRVDVSSLEESLRRMVAALDGAHSAAEKFERVMWELSTPAQRRRWARRLVRETKWSAYMERIARGKEKAHERS